MKSTMGSSYLLRKHRQRESRRPCRHLAHNEHCAIIGYLGYQATAPFGYLNRGLPAPFLGLSLSSDSLFLPTSIFKYCRFNQFCQVFMRLNKPIDPRAINYNDFFITSKDNSKR